MEGGNTGAEDFGGLGPDWLRQARAVAFEQSGRPFHDRDAAAQIVRGPAPSLGTRALQGLEGGQRLLEIVDVPGRLGLMEAPVLRRAFGHAVGT